MGERKGISREPKQLPASASGLPVQPPTGETDHRLEVVVIFTSVQATIAALKIAGGLVSGLSPRLTLVAPQVVPYALPLECPLALPEFTRRQLREIATESPVETSVHLYLYRDQLTTITAVLKPQSLVVIGSHRRWWPREERRLARKLRRAGHEVILTEIA